MKKLMMFFVLLFLLVLSSCGNLLVDEESGLYTVTFETNGGTEIPAFKTNKITLIPKTQKDGWDFVGWYTSTKFEEEIYFPFELSDDITLYAKWKEHIPSYSVVFESNGGSQVEAFYGPIIAAAPASLKQGYTLAGWYLDKDFQTSVSFPYTPKRNCVLYAKWNARTDIKYLVKHYQQESDLCTYKLYDTEEKIGTFDAETQAEAKAYTGFHNNDFEQKIIVAEGTTEVEIYYDRDAITVVFDSNNGSGKTGTQTFYYGVGQTLKANQFTRQNYLFDGWSETESGAGAKYSDGVSVTFSYSSDTKVTLYANWTYGTYVTNNTISTLNLSALKEDYIIKVTGDISQKDLVNLATKISAANKNITLDLSGTVGLEAIACATNSTSIFAKCTQLTNVILPSTLTTIGKYAFANCSSLTSITIPSSVKTIGAYAFYSCSGFISIKLDSQNIGEKAFSSCKSLTAVTFTSNVKMISSYVFQNCNVLSSVTFLDTKNWYRDTVLMDVTNPGKNASNLTGSSTVWTKK